MLFRSDGYPNFQKGNIYDGDHRSFTGDIRVSLLAIAYPKDWELIKEELLCTEKKIIGYKLKDNLWVNELRKKSFLEGVCKIGLITGEVSVHLIETNTSPKIPAVLDNFVSAGVLDLWFEPVYEKSCPDITINGYKGEFFDTHVKFGCAEIHKQLFLELYAVKDSTWTNGREIESVTIGKGTFTKDQIKEIAEYYLNK